MYTQYNNIFSLQVSPALPLPKRRTQFLGGEMTISDLHKSDHGVYECVVSNDVATIVARTQLLIGEKKWALKTQDQFIVLFQLFYWDQILANIRSTCTFYITPIFTNTNFFALFLQNAQLPMLQPMLPLPVPKPLLLLLSGCLVIVVAHLVTKITK